jgi:hypothetical protein
MGEPAYYHSYFWAPMGSTPIFGASEGFAPPNQIFRFPQDFTILVLSNGARILRLQKF